jgi:hypothetical protein
VENKFGSWVGIPIIKTEGFTMGKKYEVFETRNSAHAMRPVEVKNDDGKKVTMFAARFVEAYE